MNNKTILKTISSALLCTIVAYQVPVLAYTKDETVYTKQKSNGENYNTVVSTHIENNEKLDTIKDMTNLLNIENTNGEEAYTQDGNIVTWNAKGNDIYYKGESTKELPIKCNIKYELNGKEISEEEIVGKSGKVKITISYENKDEHIVEINGKEEKMYTPFVVVTGTIINNENNKNIEVKNAKLINDGTKTMLVGITIPGLQESLKLSNQDIELPEEIEITMEASEYEQNNIITFVTTNITQEDNTEISNKLEEIYSKVNTLQNASNELVNGTSELKNGTAKLKKGTYQLSNELNSKIKQYEKIRTEISNKDEIKKQIINILNKEMEKMLPSIQKQAQIEATKVIRNHKTELEKEVQKVSITYTKKAINEKLAQIEKNGGDILTKEQRANLEKALSKDIKAVYDETANNVTVKALLSELQQAMKKEAKSKVTTVINSKKVNAGTLTPSQIQGLAQAHANEIASIRTINPSITNEQALQIIGVVSNATLDSVEKEINTKIDSISAQNASMIEQEIKKQIDEYLTKVTQDVADKFTKGNIEILKQYETQIKNNIIQNLKNQLMKDSTIQAYINQAQKEITNTIDTVMEQTAQELASKYTEQIANEIVTNMVKKQLSGELAGTEIDNELSKYETVINTKLNEVDSEIKTLKIALVQLTEGTSQLDNGAQKLENGMKQFNDEGIQQICNIVNNDVKNIQTRANKLIDLAKNYNHLGIENEDNDTNTKFIIITDAIKKEENDENKEE